MRADWFAGFDPLWGMSGYLQRFCDEPPDCLLDHISRLLRDQPAQLRLMLVDRLSPAFAELLTSKMEERAAQDNGAALLSPDNCEKQTCMSDMNHFRADHSTAGRTMLAVSWVSLKHPQL